MARCGGPGDQPRTQLSMSDSPPSRQPRLWLRRADQACVAALIAVSLGVIAGRHACQSVRQGGRIDIDRAPRQTARFRVDINRASWPELAQLPNIGETLARRIVESRQAEGPFLDHRDLRRVRAIGPKTPARIRPYLLPMPDAEAIGAREP